MNTTNTNIHVAHYSFNTKDIRVVTLNDLPWFVAADACRVLGLRTDNGAWTLRHLDEAEKYLLTSTSGGGFRGTGCWTVSESGLYKLIMRSDKPEAKPFQDWVTKVVLPAIRKDGAYIMGEEKVASGEMSEDELVLKAVGILQKKVERLTAERDLADLVSLW